MAKVDRRETLQVLTRARLIELGHKFGLDVNAHKDVIVDLLARSRQMSHEAILEALSRKELEKICRARRLGAKATQRAELIERILGRSRRSGKESPGPLQPLVDELKRNYCRELLAESPSMSAAAKVAGFTPRGFQLMLTKLGMKAEDYLGGS